MSRLVSVSKHWRKSPPVHRLVAAYLDYKPKGNVPHQGMDDDALRLYIESNGMSLPGE